MNRFKLIAAGLCSTLVLGCSGAAQDESAQEEQITTPEGALLDTSGDLAYDLAELTDEQLNGSTRAMFEQDSMNVFRRFPRDQTEQMVSFYTEALALQPLNPIQLTSSQQMLLTKVGSGQIKLAAGQQGDRKYNLDGGATGGTGIRYFVLTYPDADIVSKRFTDAGFDAPQFSDRGDGTQGALVTDPAGFPIEIIIRPGAKDNSNDGVGVGIGASNLEESRAFYREFVGLDELEPVTDPTLDITRYPYRHKETTIYLHDVGEGAPADNGSAGVQYVVSDAPLADAKARHRNIAVETPLNKLRGFDLTTVWLNDPDGVTNYYAQVGPNSRTAQARTGDNGGDS